MAFYQKSTHMLALLVEFWYKLLVNSEREVKILTFQYVFDTTIKIVLTIKKILYVTKIFILYL